MSKNKGNAAVAHKGPSAVNSKPVATPTAVVEAPAKKEKAAEAPKKVLVTTRQLADQIGCKPAALRRYLRSLPKFQDNGYTRYGWDKDNAADAQFLADVADHYAKFAEAEKEKNKERLEKLSKKKETKAADAEGKNKKKATPVAEADEDESEGEAEEEEEQEEEEEEDESI